MLASLQSRELSKDLALLAHYQNAGYHLLSRPCYTKLKPKKASLGFTEELNGTKFSLQVAWWALVLAP